MRAGSLRHLVEIQERSTSHEPTYGGQVETWTTIATPYAAIRPLSGRELLANDGVQAERTHEVELRFMEGITAAHRVKFGARIFDIAQVLDVEERARTLRLQCHEGLDQGIGRWARPSTSKASPS
jgi:SPP1 family predicted phage head-tail adaptor